MPRPDETKDFDPAVIASLTSGVVLVENGFSLMHEAAEWLLGHPVWTHEFGSKALWEKMAALVVAQFPDMPTDENTTQENWQQVAVDVRARYGATIAVARGDERRAADPLTTLREALGPDRDKDIIVVTTDAA